MATKNNISARIETLKNAGINTDGLFKITANGVEVTIKVGAGGTPVVVDDLEEQIISDGYVKNTKLHRRWIMGQMFWMLGSRDSYMGTLTKFGCDYAWRMLCDELKTIAHLQKADQQCFEDRVRWFNIDVVIRMMEEYLAQLRYTIEHKLPTKRCKRVPYKKISAIGNVFVSDLDKRLYSPIMNLIHRWKKAAASGHVDYAMLHSDVENFVRCARNTKGNLYCKAVQRGERQCEAWRQAYAGTGAFYTLDNMIKFHGCHIWTDNGECLDMYASLDYVRDAAREYAAKGEGWRMLAMLRKCIADNNFKYTNSAY